MTGRGGRAARLSAARLHGGHFSAGAPAESIKWSLTGDAPDGGARRVQARLRKA